MESSQLKHHHDCKQDVPQVSGFTNDKRTINLNVRVGHQAHKVCNSTDTQYTPPFPLWLLKLQLELKSIQCLWPPPFLALTPPNKTPLRNNHNCSKTAQMWRHRNEMQDSSHLCFITFWADH